MPIDKERGDYIMNNNDDAYELLMYCLNNARLYGIMRAHFLNLRAKSRKGVYDHAKAAKAWKYVVDEGNKLYRADFGHNFIPSTRMEAAHMMADYFRDGVEKELK